VARLAATEAACNGGAGWHHGAVRCMKTTGEKERERRTVERLLLLKWHEKIRPARGAAVKLLAGPY
jgi:hypothetical protein